MPIKIDYKKCCWNAQKSDTQISGVPKSPWLFEQNGKCTSCTCGGPCEGCVEACPVQALKREKRLVFDASKCISCGACVVSCKHGAITLE